MRKITKIDHISEWESGGKSHTKTFVVLDDGGTAAGYGIYKLGEFVEVWYDQKYDEVKIKRRGRKRTKGDSGIIETAVGEQNIRVEKE